MSIHDVKIHLSDEDNSLCRATRSLYRPLMITKEREKVTCLTCKKLLVSIMAVEKLARERVRVSAIKNER